jgi:hypothetical protein
MEWKWTPSNKEINLKTSRYYKREKTIEEEIEIVPDFSNMACQHSLECNENNGWETDKFIENNFKASNKREDAYNKISEREMISRIGHNPFLENNDYVKNIVEHDLFLKPISTNFDKEKKKELE